MRRKNSAYRVSDLSAAMEAIAPSHLAEAWDNVGLLAGRPEARVRKVRLAIDLTRAVHDDVVADGAEALVVYHPAFIKPLKNLQIRGDEAPQLALSLLTHGVALYAPHTALDVAEGGTNDALAELLGLKVTGSISRAGGRGQYLKLVTFVPEADVEQLAEAVFAAGAGQIGTKSKYTQCSFRAIGTGTFKGDEATNPAVGTAGVYERVPEIRFETVLPASLAGAVIEALRAAHPYEEPAFDLLTMQTPPEKVGLGRYADMPQPTTLSAFAADCGMRLGVAHPAVVGNPKKMCRRAVLVAGSAGRIVLEQSREAYDVLVTGELKHHDMLAYQAAGVGVVCLGHSETERPVLAKLGKTLREHLPGLDVRISKCDRSPFWVL